MDENLKNNKIRKEANPEFMPVLILDEAEKPNSKKTSNTNTSTDSNYTECEEYSKKYEESQKTTQTIDSNKNISQEEKKPLPKKNPNPLEIINVIRNYDWTYSRDKIRKIDEIPYVYLKEFKIAANSYVSSLMTSALLFPDVLSGNAKAAQGLGTVAKGMVEKLDASFKNNELGKFMKNVSAAAGGATDFAKQQMSNITEMSKKASQWAKEQVMDQTANEWGADKQSLIDNYSLLYLRQPTERSYIFPFFTNSFVNISNEFSDSYDAPQTPAQQSLANITEMVKKAPSYIDIGSAAEPGMYIQRPKFYNFSSQGYTTEVDFFLFNTITPFSYEKNLKLITKLLIQNTPHRYNRILVDPPCIYELTIPGRGFYPYVYISEFSVVHHGTKRVINAGGKKLIVPDAFEVKLKLTSLTSEVNNFIIPETGSAGIDVSKRYGLDTSDMFKKMSDAITTKPTQDPPKSTNPVEEAQTKQAQQVDTPEKAAKLANEQKNYQASTFWGMARM